MLQRQDTVTMGACCGGMKTGQHKSLPENEKANNVDEKDKSANGVHGDAAVTKETTVTADQQHQEASVNHTADHAQPSTASPDEVELKITEPERSEPEPTPAVCPVEEKPEHPSASAAEPTVSDAGVEKDQNKPSTEVLFVSEDSDVMRPKNESTSEVHVTTTRVEQTQMSCTTEVRQSTETTSTDVQKDDKQQEVGDVGVVESVKPGTDVVASADVLASPGAEVLQTSSSVVVEQTSTSVEVTDDADHAPAAMTGDTEDHQKQADTDVVVEAPAAEVVVAASAVDQQESAPPAPPAATERPEHNVANDAEQLSTPPVASEEAVDLPATTVGVEPGVDEAKREEVTSVEAGELPVQPQQQPATDDVQTATEQMPPSENIDAGVPSIAAETPLAADVPAEMTDVAHEELNPAAEHTAQSNVSTSESVPSADTATSVVDDSATKPEDAAVSSVTQGEVVDVQPEELPPPLTPEKDTAAPVNEEFQQAPATACYVEPSTDTSQQPEQHPVEEPTSKSTTEATDHVDEVPVVGEP